MPTSAAGSSVATAAGGRGAGPRGFTLVELLVVLLVMALLTGLTALALPRSGQDSMQREAERLAALLDAARQQAAARGEPLAWAPGAAGYTFLQPSPAGWVPLNDAPLIARAWQWLDAGGAPSPDYLPRADGSAVRAGNVVVEARGGASGTGASTGWLVFGTEPVSPPMQVTLQGDGRVITIASNGLAPFAVAGQR